MDRQPAQRAASSWNLTVSLPSENVLFLLTTRKKEKRKQKPERKVPEHYSKELKALVYRAYYIESEIIALSES